MGKSAESLALGNAGLLQQRQAAAARADKDKLRAVAAQFSSREIADAHAPAGQRTRSRSTTRWLVAMPQPSCWESQSSSLREMEPKLTSVPSSIFVAAIGTSPRPSVSSGAHLAIVGGVGSELHLLEEMVRAHALVARPQEIHLVLAVHEAEMRHRIDEILRVRDFPLATAWLQKRRDLLELLEDPDRLAHLHRAIGLAERRVTQLTNASVPGARIVPAVRRLLRDIVRSPRKPGCAVFGSRLLSRAPRLADITPLPIRMTSGFSMWVE